MHLIWVGQDTTEVIDDIGASNLGSGNDTFDLVMTNVLSNEIHEQMNMQKNKVGVLNKSDSVATSKSMYSNNL